MPGHGVLPCHLITIHKWDMAMLVHWEIPTSLIQYRSCSNVNTVPGTVDSTNFISATFNTHPTNCIDLPILSTIFIVVQNWWSHSYLHNKTTFLITFFTTKSYNNQVIKTGWEARKVSTGTHSQTIHPVIPWSTSTGLAWNSTKPTSLTTGTLPRA